MRMRCLCAWRVFGCIFMGSLHVREQVFLFFNIVQGASLLNLGP